MKKLKIISIVLFAILYSANTYAYTKDDFVITIKTTKPNEDFIIYNKRGFTYNYNVDCNNNGTYNFKGQTAKTTCTYPKAGIHTIAIVDNIGDKTGYPVINFGGNYSYSNIKKLQTVEQWGTSKWKTMNSAFKGASNLTTTSSKDQPDLSNVTDMTFMFSDATSANPDVSKWDVSNVTDMSSMFSSASSANPDVSKWDVSNVTDMSYMFSSASSANPDVSNWNVSNVTDMGLMFYFASSANPDVSNWNVSNVTNMRSMFNYTTKANPDVSKWDVSNVTDMSSMFYNATKANPDVSKWDVSNVTNMWSMFSSASSANPDVSKWDVSNVTDMSSMFSGATKANPDVSNWNVSNVTDMRSMFYGVISANPDVSNWDVSNVTDMALMFYNAKKANPDVSKWDVSNVTNMDDMFYNATKANPDVSKWDVSNVTDMSYMFSSASSANPDVSNWNVSKVTSISYIFDNSAMSITNYDKLLNSWSKKTLQKNLDFGVYGLTYCKASQARDKIIKDYNWTFIGDKKCQKFTLTFNTNGGNNINNISVSSNTIATKPTDPTKTGHTFGGWFKDSALKNTFNFTTEKITSNTTVYAKWITKDYTVTFNTNGGSTITTKTTKYNTSVTKPTDPTKTGHTFGGWFKDSALKNTFNFTTEKITSNTTVYAKWITKDYTVTFNTNGGSTITTKTTKYNTSVTKPTDPTKTGHTFGGWFKDSALKNTFNFTTEKITSNTTVYAKWITKDYTVTFNTNGGSTITTKTTKYNTSVTKPTDPTKTGHTFGGWFKDSALKNTFNFTTEKITSNTTVYAKWITKDYTVTFNTNGGSTITTKTTKYNTSVTKPTDPTKTGHTFGGWFKDSALKNTFNFTTEKITSNTTVYAKWITKDYTVTFNTNGGSTITTKTTKYNTSVTKPTDPTKTGHTFGGWFKDSALKNTFNFTTEKITSNTTVYAKWIDTKAPTATVSYSTTKPTDKDVVVTLIASEDINTPSGWTKVNSKEFTKTISVNTSGDVNVSLTDKTGNKGTVKYNVSNIDKTKPIKPTIKPSNGDKAEGTAEANSEIEVTDSKGNTLCKTTTDSKGNYQCNLNPKQSDGETITVKSKDKAGNESTESIVIDKTKPIKPTIKPSNGDKAEGTAEANSEIEVTDSKGNTLCKTTTDSKGNYQCNLNPKQSDGETITVKSKDKAGNESTESIVIDKTKPIKPTIKPSNGDKAEGTAEANSEIEVTDSKGNTLCKTTTDSKGNYQCNLNPKQSDGETITVKSKDKAGNESTESIVIDKTKPIKPTIKPSNGDKAEGTAEANSEIEVTDSKGNTLCKTTTDSKGNYQCNLNPKQSDGETITVKSKDKAGNESTESIVIDKTKPIKPTIKPSNGDKAEGTAEANSEIEVTDSKGNTLCKTTTDSKGNYQCNLNPKQSDGETITVKSKDKAGNESTESIVIDKTKPIKPTIKPSNGDKAEGTAEANSEIEVTDSKGNTLCKTTTDSKGNYQCNLNPKQSDGETITVKSKDKAGNESTESIVIDKTKPIKPTIKPSNGDKAEGTAEANSEIEVTDSKGNTLCKTTTDSKGNYQCNLNPKQSDGETITVKSKDKAGNESTESIVIDKTKPIKPTIKPSNGDKAEGTAEANSEIEVTDSKGNTLCKTTTDSKGNYQCNLNPKQSDGETITVKSKDKAGNESTESIVIDKTKPIKPTIKPSNGDKAEGTAEANSEIEVTDSKGNTLCKTTTDSKGNYQCNLNPKQSDGETITVKSKDKAGNESTESIVIDKTKPIKPTIKPSNGDKAEGTAEANSEIEVTDSKGNTLCKTTTDSKGNYQCNLNPKQSDGETITVKSKDKAGNESTESIVIDKTKPIKPTIKPSNGDKAEGTAEANSEIEVTDSKGNTLCKTTTDSKGNYQCNLNPKQSDGETITVKSKDKAGNESTESIVIDKTKPIKPTIKPSNGDKAEGTAEANSEIEVTDSKGNTLCKTTTDSKGNYQCNLNPKQSDGETITVKSKDKAGNESTESIVIDKTKPIKPTIKPSNGDKAEGTAEANSEIEVTDSKGNTLCKTTTDSKGNYQCNLNPKQSDGETITVKSKDKAGNESTESIVIKKKNNNNNTNHSSSFTTQFTCKDKKAINYDRFGRHKQSLCKYKNTIDNPLNGNKCINKLIITDNLINPSTDGRYSAYNKGKVTQVKILQSHINRILKDEYKQAAGPIDGYYRTKTKRGVKRLQTKLNIILKGKIKPLTVDGIVGPYTKQAINYSC